MKRYAFLISCLTVLTMNTFAQQVIKASAAIKYVGREVVVADSVYNIKAYSDSTAVIDLGGKNLKAPLNIVLDFNSKLGFDAKFIKNFKEARIAVTGFVILVDDQPAIVVTEKQKIKFLSGGANKKWLSTFAMAFRNGMAEK